MRIGSKLMLGFFIIFSLASLIGAVSLFELDKIAQPLKKDIPQSIDAIANTSYLSNLAGLVRYYDEVLTQSARNYAFTKDKKWKERYQDFEPKLDNAIKEAIQKGNSNDKRIFGNIDKANIALVDMEHRSVKFVDDYQPEKAIAILESAEYGNQKNIYASGLEDFIQRKYFRYDEAVTGADKLLSLLLKDTKTLIQSSTVLILALLGATVLLSFFIGMYISRSISRPLKVLYKGAEVIGSGDLNYKININSDDEIGQLSRAFDMMTDNLKYSTTSIDKLNKESEEREKAQTQLSEKIKQLETFNRAAVDRELKMIELKEKIKKLEAQLQQK